MCQLRRELKLISCHGNKLMVLEKLDKNPLRLDTALKYWMKNTQQYQRHWANKNHLTLLYKNKLNFTIISLS